MITYTKETYYEVKEDIKDLKLPWLHAGAKYRPAIILGTRISTFASKVEGKSGSPGKDDDRHDVEPRIVEMSSASKFEDVDDWSDRPHPVDR